jgi:hypothetical protein
MATAAQIAANRQNAQKSTGPRTVEGKSISRANAWKHGLAGDGIVLPNEDLQAIATIQEELEAQLKPSGRLGKILLERVATLSIRLRRCVEFDVALLTQRRREACQAYDDARAKNVETTLEWLGAEPESRSRILEQTPEGVDRKIKAWRDLRFDVENAGHRWGYHHWRLADNLMGKNPEQPPYSRFGALCQVIWGQPSYLEPQGMEPAEKITWARNELYALIDAEIARLDALLDTFDYDKIAQDRAEAVPRANFDVSSPAALARRYERATERAMMEAIREFRQVELEAKLKSETQAQIPVPPELASSGQPVLETPPGSENRPEPAQEGEILARSLADPVSQPVSPSPRGAAAEVSPRSGAASSPGGAASAIGVEPVMPDRG